ncbi:MAG TPA: TonB-dependent receptor [Burkholderiaceae bacterium]|nr:TonB-dependent receptor [Burkholderiaceae bacterium]
MSSQPAFVRRTGWRTIRRLCGCMALLSLVESAALAGDTADQVDLAQLPIEQLLSLEVYSASKFVQKASEAPSAVSVITAADIRSFGWRTLADILRSMRGLYVGYDRNYSYLGARGFLRPGDYSTRFLLLVDGYRTNDSVYDQAAIGSEFILDVDLIDRVEFVPGPGSSIYGANAFFGTINVITKRGRDINGPQASVDIGSFGARKGRATYGWRDGKGAELLLSASGFQVAGQDLYFPEFDSPATSGGVAQGLDYDRGQSLFIKGSLGQFGMSLAHAERKKGVPTASFGQAFNDPRSYTVDTQTFADLTYRNGISDHTEVTGRAYWGRYDYEGDYIYDRSSSIVNRDGSRAHWWGAEAKLTSTAIRRHKLVAGVEAQHDYRRDQYNFNTSPGPILASPGTLPATVDTLLDDRRRDSRLGVYVQDEMALRSDLLLNAGLRYDHHSTTDGILNPRLGLIFKLSPSTTVKTLYGTAFRAPNAYELYYAVPGDGGQKANPDLHAERIHSRELVLEHYFTPDSRITASIFHNAVTNLITQTLDPADGLLVFRNLDRVVARGMELEFGRMWAGGAKLNANYSWQYARDESNGAELVNSPRHLAKFNLSAPVFSQLWRTGLEAQYVGRRNTLAGTVGGYWLANMTLFSARLVHGVEISASVYNAFNHRYADPGSDAHVQDAIPQDGRSFRLKLTHGF